MFDLSWNAIGSLIKNSIRDLINNVVLQRSGVQEDRSSLHRQSALAQSFLLQIQFLIEVPHPDLPDVLHDGGITTDHLGVPVAAHLQTASNVLHTDKNSIWGANVCMKFNMKSNQGQNPADRGRTFPGDNLRDLQPHSADSSANIDCHPEGRKTSLGGGLMGWNVWTKNTFWHTWCSSSPSSETSTVEIKEGKLGLFDVSRSIP